MIRTLLCTTALMIAAPALAQSANSTPPAQDPVPAEAVTPEAAQAEPQAAQPSDVAAIVESEFPAYDLDKSGQLELAEFSKWMVALKEQELKATGNTLPAAEVTAWASGAFTAADADQSAAVSKAELVTYLTGGAG